MLLRFHKDQTAGFSISIKISAKKTRKKENKKCKTNFSLGDFAFHDLVYLHRITSIWPLFERFCFHHLRRCYLNRSDDLFVKINWFASNDQYQNVYPMLTSTLILWVLKMNFSQKRDIISLINEQCSNRVQFFKTWKFNNGLKFSFFLLFNWLGLYLIAFKITF